MSPLSNRWLLASSAFALLASCCAQACGAPEDGDPEASPSSGPARANDGGEAADGAKVEARPPLEPMDLVGYVDPRIGTAPAPSIVDPIGGGRGGSVFPGAVAPFGMVQWSPDTPNGEPSGYLYTDDRINGFSLTHFSGAGCPNNSDVPFLPATSTTGGDLVFKHTNEHASPGYYDVALDNGIHVELTATLRTGFGRFTYPASGEAVLLIDAKRNATGGAPSATANALSDTELAGTTTGGNFCGAKNSHDLHFSIRFDHPFELVSPPGDGRVVLRFPGAVGKTVLSKVGISYVSRANAAANLAAENPGWDFDATRAATSSAWNARLNAIRVTGGSDEPKKKFYTALYHSLISPNVYSDDNGQYLGFDDKVHEAPSGHPHYANFSNWDIYRTQVQLVATLFPTDASDMAQSLVDDAARCGALPKWSQNNDETAVMSGDPGSLVVANIHAFGARAFDAKRALSQMITVGSRPGTACNGYRPLPALDQYLQYGYLGVGAEWGPTSAGLEYGLRDFAVAELARALGDIDQQRILRARSANWQNGLHPNGLFEPREISGAWKPLTNGPGDGSNIDYVEGNAEQYTWSVPHDPRTLFDRLGGNAAVVARLDAFFGKLNAGTKDPNFYMGNEPSFGTPWLYDWAGAPWRTQDVVRRIVDGTFGIAPGGLPGNDDLGATSSWLVWSMLGLYPAIPGVGGFAVGAPAFETMDAHFGDGLLQVTASNSPSRYVQSVALRGAPHPAPWLSREALKGGATLDFVLGEAPSTWGSEPSSAPPSFGPGTFASIDEALNAKGIGSDNVSLAASFDGADYAYSAQALEAAGFHRGQKVIVNGVELQWPKQDGLDHAIAVGQTIAFPKPQAGKRLVLLGASSVGDATGDFVITFDDGSKKTIAMGLSDWTLHGGAAAPQFGNTVAAKLPYRNNASGTRENVATYVYFASAAIDAQRPVASVTLPGRVSVGRMHLFALRIVP
jgi:predicted alpha-1,2-mannosidase